LFLKILLTIIIISENKINQDRFKKYCIADFIFVCFVFKGSLCLILEGLLILDIYGYSLIKYCSYCSVDGLLKKERKFYEEKGCGFVAKIIFSRKIF